MTTATISNEAAAAPKPDGSEIILQRWEGMPEPDQIRADYGIQPIPMVSQAHLWNQWVQQDYASPIAGIKGTYPINIEHMKRKLPVGVAYANIEFGREIWDLTVEGKDYTARASAIDHIGRIALEAHRIGCAIMGVYQAGFHPVANPDRAFHSDLEGWQRCGKPSRLILGQAGTIDLAWVKRIGPRIERAKALADHTGAQIVLMVSPRRPDGTLYPMDEWEVIAFSARKAMQAVGGRVCAFMDGAYRDPDPDSDAVLRYGFELVEPYIQAMTAEKGGAS